MAGQLTQAERLTWVDMAKGLSIMLVVMLHTVYGVGEATGQTSYLHWLVGFATPFRMPEFFLISGLFLANVINRDWRKFADRRVVHYFYFYGLWALILCGIKCGLIEGRPDMTIRNLLISFYQPYSVLWFIYLLAAFSAVIKLVHDRRIPHWAMIAVGVAMQIAPVHSGFYVIDNFAEYLVYFYLGYAGAPLVFRLVKWAQNDLPYAVLGLMAWALLNGALVFSNDWAVLPGEMQMGLAALPGLRLVLAIAGSLAICTFAGVLARLPRTKWLAWLGARSIVIYLAFSLPMAISRVILLKLIPGIDVNILATLVFGIAIASPLILYGAVQVTGWGRFLFERPAWAHIPEQSRARPARVPAE